MRGKLFRRIGSARSKAARVHHLDLLHASMRNPQHLAGVIGSEVGHHVQNGRSDVFRLAHGIVARAALTPSQIRTQAKSLVLRSTQAYLTARRGAGFRRTDPAQRWARQALFFLVWSCPTPVAQAAIRDLAGLCQV